MIQVSKVQTQTSKILPIRTEGLKATRDGFGEGLLALGKSDPKVVVLCADLKDSTRVAEFAKLFPGRFVEVGVAEQNLVTLAAGLGVSGKIPFISSYAVFCPGRTWEQIRTTVAYNDSNVKIAGHHAGISVGPDGATHQAIEDIATMRVIPGMRVIVPCDAIEARKATVAAASIWGPVYLRFGREATPVITSEETPFVPDKAQVLRQSARPKVLIVGCGPILHEALLAAEELENEKTGSIVLNMHTVKPLDEKALGELAKKVEAVVTVEEHNIVGGLGGAVAEALARLAPRPIEFVGIKDVFAESGNPGELAKKYGLTAKDVRAAVKKAIRRA